MLAATKVPPNSCAVGGARPHLGRRGLVPMQLRSGRTNRYPLTGGKPCARALAPKHLAFCSQICILLSLFWLQPKIFWAQSNSQSSPAPSGQTADETPPSKDAATPSKAEKQTEEITSREETTTFRVNVNLVQVRIVVRDPAGRAIGDLTKEDFALFDNRKPQVITQFAVEKAGSEGALAHPHHDTPAVAEGETSVAPNVGENYVAYLFDDIHLDFGDLARARDATERHLASLKPTDRAAIFTTSGQTQLDFSEDRAALKAALLRMQPRTISRTPGSDQCFDISYYMADQIQNKHDQRAMDAATQDALICNFNGDTRYMAAAQQLVDTTSREKLSLGEHESHVALTVINDIVRRMGAIPGQRRIVLISPGFLTPEMEAEYTTTIDRALKAQVVIGALDARGLYVIGPSADVSRSGGPSPITQAIKTQYASLESSANIDVLTALTEGTGGTLFHNNNDMDEGLRRTADAPEYSYLLAFAPQNLKLDGGFHSIKVTIKKPGKFTLQARRGYFAPKRASDPQQQAKQEIEEALFSQEEVRSLPVQLHTQFFKATDTDAKLTVLAHVDVKRLALKKVDGRNNDELTVVSALFNANGSLLQGIQKTVTMKIKDETLEKRLGSGITVRTSFDVKPGSYLVRLVVRDAEAQTVSAASDAVRIP